MDEYSVILRGETFILTKDQILHDSPDTNYFSSCFLRGTFVESTTRVVKLGRHPTLFRIILDHMSGYDILPLDACALPRGMSVEATLKNLYADAQFYGLEKLCDLLAPRPLDNCLQWAGFHGPVIEWEDVLGGKLPAGVKLTRQGLISLGGTGRGEEHELPVLILAKDVPFSLNGSWNGYLQDDIPEGTQTTYFLGVSSSQEQILKQHELLKFAQPPFWVPGLLPHGYKWLPANHAGATLILDGSSTKLTSFDEWWSSRFSHALKGDEMKELFRPFDAAFRQISDATLQRSHVGDEYPIVDRHYITWVKEVLFYLEATEAGAMRPHLLHLNAITKGSAFGKMCSMLQTRRGVAYVESTQNGAPGRTRGSGGHGLGDGSEMDSADIAEE